MRIDPQFQGFHLFADALSLYLCIRLHHHAVQRKLSGLGGDDNPVCPTLSKAFVCVRSGDSEASWFQLETTAADEGVELALLTPRKRHCPICLHRPCRLIPSFP